MGTIVVTAQSQNGYLIVIGWCFIAAQAATTHPPSPANGRPSLGTIAAQWRRPPGGATSDARERQRRRSAAGAAPQLQHGPLVTATCGRRRVARAATKHPPSAANARPSPFPDGRAVTPAASSGGATCDTGVRHQHRQGRSCRNADCSTSTISLRGSKERSCGYLCSDEIRLAIPGLISPRDPLPGPAKIPANHNQVAVL